MGKRGGYGLLQLWAYGTFHNGLGSGEFVNDRLKAAARAKMVIESSR